MSWMTGKEHQKVLFVRSKGESEPVTDVSPTHCIYIGKRVAEKLPRHSAGWPIRSMMTCRDMNDLWNRRDSILPIPIYGS